VLSLPLAFILSQDQTLRCNCKIIAQDSSLSNSIKKELTSSLPDLCYSSNLFKELSFSKSGAKIEEKYRLPNFPETFFSTSACRLKNTSIKNGMQIYGNTPIQQTVHQNIFI
jgi:hypothetical protein